jgi:hypothetical protein
MSECTENEIRDALPDLLHGTLAAATRERIEAHVASCAPCREELEVLRTVKSAAIFAPVINIESIVRRIPPHRTIVPAVERPATARIVSWLVAASLAIAVVGGGSLVLTRPYVPKDPPVVGTTPPPGSITTQRIPESPATPKSVSPAETTVSSVQPHALALAADVDGLSDGSLAQLMDEMSRFDALPAAEVDPVMFVDTSFNLEQDSR